MTATPLLRLWRSVPVRLFVVFLAIYGLTAGVSLGRHSLAPHFVYLAESFLHGHLDLVHVPDPSYDLTSFEGRWYVSFPPLPTVLMLPLVAVRGLAVSDIAFSVVVGALSISLFYVVLARLRIEDWGSGLWLCVLVGLGTPLWYCAAFGSVWYTAHVVAVTCLCLYALEVVGQNRPVWAGLWLGLGFLARVPVLLAFPLSLVTGLWKARNRWEAARILILFALGTAPALVGQAGYNWARFGNPLEFGYRWMNSPGPLLERQVTWGQFSLHFLPENLYTLLVRPPLISLAPFRIVPNPWGMGLLLTCPALLLGLRGTVERVGQRLSSRRRLCPPGMVPSPQRSATFARVRWLRLGSWLAVALVLVPSLLYFNTGSYQFGYRFALDWLPLGVLLVALGTDGRLRPWGKVLIVVSVLMHLWGVLWMYPNFNGQPWHVQYVQLGHDLLRWAIDVAR
jgi:hypothetical protein